MPIQLTDPQGKRIREGLADVKYRVSEALKSSLASALGPDAGVPRQVTAFAAELDKLEVALKPGSAVSSAASLPDALAPVVAAVAAYHRRKFVTQIEEYRTRALAGELLENLDAAKAVIDDLLVAPWYHATTPLRIPRLSDIVAKGRGDRPAVEIPGPPRALDDKFGILWSASEFWNDLRHAREQCEERSAPVTIAFADVDGLKALNTELGEPWVDALIFPPLMRCIERTVYGKGYAYRHGGDEFVLLLPSADQEVGLAILHQLRRNVESTAFEKVAAPTVSTGLCVLEPDSPLTDREALVWAARAKAEAKTHRAKGHLNAIAVFRGGMWIDRRDITVTWDQAPGAQVTQSLTSAER